MTEGPRHYGGAPRHLARGSCQTMRSVRGHGFEFRGWTRTGELPRPSSAGTRVLLGGIGLVERLLTLFLSLPELILELIFLVLLTGGIRFLTGISSATILALAIESRPGVARRSFLGRRGAARVSEYILALTPPHEGFVAVVGLGIAISRRLQ